MFRLHLAQRRRRRCLHLAQRPRVLELRVRFRGLLGHDDRRRTSPLRGYKLRRMLGRGCFQRPRFAGCGRRQRLRLLGLLALTLHVRFRGLLGRGDRRRTSPLRGYELRRMLGRGCFQRPRFAGRGRRQRLRLLGLLALTLHVRFRGLLGRGDRCLTRRIIRSKLRRMLLRGGGRPGGSETLLHLAQTYGERRLLLITEEEPIVQHVARRGRLRIELPRVERTQQHVLAQAEQHPLHPLCGPQLLHSH